MRIIAGRWRGRRLTPLSGRDVRPTSDRVRESWMSAMGGRFDGLEVIDLFAGSGALGLECLSRGARHCTFVEAATSSIRVIEANIRLLGAEDIVSVVRADALAWARGRKGQPRADVAVADPPYGKGFAAALISQFHADPFASELWVEHRFDETLPDLPGLRSRRYGDTALTSLFAPESET